MYTEVTQEQVDTYQRDGCLILGDFLTPAELEWMRAAGDGLGGIALRPLCDARTPRTAPGPHSLRL